VIGNEYEIDSESFWLAEQILGELFGEGLIDEFLQSSVFGQGFQDGGGDGAIIGRPGEISAGGEEGLDAAQGAKKDGNEDGITTFGTVVLFHE